jgi:hypothetical protein
MPGMIHLTFTLMKMSLLVALVICYAFKFQMLLLNEDINSFLVLKRSVMFSKF